MLRLNLKNNQGGTSLIEVIIYTAILSMVFFTTISEAFLILKSSEDVVIKTAREEEANFLLRKFAWTMNSGGSVLAPGANSSSTSFKINKGNFDDNPIALSYSSNTIWMSLEGGENTWLSNESVAISDAQFYHRAASGTIPAAIEFEFSIGENHYETLIYLRK
jgi:hypothetical protein